MICKFCRNEVKEFDCCHECGTKLICFNAEMMFSRSIFLELNETRLAIEDIKSELSYIKKILDLKINKDLQKQAKKLSKH